MHNFFRYTAPQETAQSFPRVRTYHDKVMVLSYLTDHPDGITYEDISRYREVRTGHYSGCIVYNLFSLLSTLSRYNIAFDSLMLADHMQWGNDREDGESNGGPKRVRSQPRVKTSRVLHVLHCKENT